MSDDEAREEKELDLTSPDVVTKYKSAAEIVNSSVSDLIYDILRCEILHDTTLIFAPCRGASVGDIQVQAQSQDC